MSEEITLLKVMSEGSSRDGRAANTRRENQGGLVNGRPNPQAFVNDSISQSLADQYMRDAQALHGPKVPNLAIDHEKAEHRLILMYKLRGDSNREIAQKTGYSESWISQVTRQPWFQQRLVNSLEEVEGEILDEIVKVEAKNSVFKLVQLRDTAKSEQVQLGSAIELLNRHLGKPVQRTETTANVFHVSAKLGDIDKQLAEVEAEEQRLLRNGSTIEPTREAAEAELPIPR
jgi:hypothetical protein